MTEYSDRVFFDIVRLHFSYFIVYVIGFMNLCFEKNT